MLFVSACARSDKSKLAQNAKGFEILRIASFIFFISKAARALLSGCQKNVKNVQKILRVNMDETFVTEPGTASSPVISFKRKGGTTPSPAPFLMPIPALVLPS